MAREVLAPVRTFSTIRTFAEISAVCAVNFHVGKCSVNVNTVFANDGNYTLNVCSIVRESQNMPDSTVAA